jgi:hypothetical protein
LANTAGSAVDPPLTRDAREVRAHLHLFEVFEKSRYVYAGEVELAGEPYMSDQNDARAEARFVWIFPIRKKQSSPGSAGQTSEAGPGDHLPFGAYAVISSRLKEEQVKLQDIADYCRSDVINTYRLWLRHELFRGRLDQTQFEFSEQNLARPSEPR